MKAICLSETGAPLELRNLPMPAPSPGEIVVRVTAAGICHSDAHYRAGTASTAAPPLALGHEVAGVVEHLGDGVNPDRLGSRVALHYLVGCGECMQCRSGREMFCDQGEMLGKDRHGGFAEYVVVPAANALEIPEGVDDAVAAIMMCSTVTALHALRRARFRPGDRVAVFGCGGLGMSAIHLAQALGAAAVFGVDISTAKLNQVSEVGAHPVNARELDPANAILAATSREGVEVSLEFVGRPESVDASIRAASVHGRAAMVSLMDVPAPVYTYRDLIAREVDVVGVSDHWRQDVVDVLAMAGSHLLRLDSVVTRRVPFDAGAVNDVLDALDAGTSDVRAVMQFG